MRPPPFDWSQARPMGWPALLLAFFGPSAFAFGVFHGLLPALVAGGMPPLLAYCYTAGGALSVLVALAVGFLGSEAKRLGVNWASRFCLAPVSPKHWAQFVAVMALAVGLSIGLAALLPGWWAAWGLEIPGYMPFFIKGLNPAATPPELLSPGLPLKGAYGLLGLFLLVLLLNILAEEFYFRAWLLPRMMWLGPWAWVANGLLFALYHTFQLWLLPVLLAVSLPLAWITWKTKSVVPSMAFHLTVNFLFSGLGLASLIF